MAWAAMTAAASGSAIAQEPGGMSAAATRSGAAGEQAPRLPTDDPVRKGMFAIRTLVLHHHTLITHRRLPPEGAVRFAAEARNLTDFIVANSKIGPEGSAALAPILGAINDGAEAIAGRKDGMDSIAGLIGIDGALAEYAEKFEHPNWAPLR
jgi:hypothetical protein